MKFADLNSNYGFSTADMQGVLWMTKGGDDNFYDAYL